MANIKFEDLLSNMLDEYGSDPDRMKDVVIEKYSSIIRKSIASEMDAESMTHKEWLRRKNEPLFWPANTERAFYKQGIKDTLKTIEKGE